MSAHPILPGLLPPAAPPIDEATLQKQLKQLFTAAGGHIYDRSQGYRKEPGGTRMTAGLSDLEIHFPRVPTVAMFEVKTEEGIQEHRKLIQLRIEQVAKSRMAAWRRAKAQERYRQLCEATKTPYGIGGFLDAWSLLMSLGLARKEGATYLLIPQGGSRPIRDDLEGAASVALARVGLSDTSELEARRAQAMGRMESEPEDPELEAFLARARTDGTGGG